VRADERGGDEVAALAHTFNQMASELDARTAALTASDRARRQLLADVSHELMTPLTAIRGYVQTLAMTDVPLDEATRKRYLAVVDEETYKLEAIIGDLLHSRVLRSNIHLLTKMGSDVWVCGPPTLIPAGIARFGVRATSNVDEAVAGADVVMLLRIQLERMEGAFFPSLREYFNVFGMTHARLRRAARDVIIMHPGPMNRGVEIASEVADGPYSVILDQVANGVAARMAVLYLLAGGGAEHEAVV